MSMRSNRLATLWMGRRSSCDTSNKEIPSENTSEYFNKFFTDIGQNLAKGFSDKWNYYGERNPNSIAPLATTIEEVIGICREIDIMKSSGMDKLSSRICKDAFLALSEQLVFLFNCSMRTAVFPDTWKTANIVPLFKGGDKGEVSNYRPVSLLPLPVKILEKIVHKNITSFLENNEVLCKA